MYAASPLHARSLFLFVTGATPGGTMGRLSTTECTYLPTSKGACRGSTSAKNRLATKSS